MAKKKKVKEKASNYIEPSKTFRFRRYGTSCVVIIDKEFRKLMGIDWERVDAKILGMRCENLSVVVLDKAIDPKQKLMKEFTEAK